jgi:hypothetical protein
MNESAPTVQAVAPIAHDQTELTSTPSAAQYAAPFPVHITFPKTIEIKMVDASTLSDYEVVMFFASAFFSAFIGFGVAWFQAATAAGLYLAITIVFGVIAAGFIVWGLVKRHKMHQETKTFRLQPTTSADS